MVELKTPDFEALAIDAERYCVGRMTYAVAEYIGIVTPHLAELPRRALVVMCNDFQEVERRAKLTRELERAEKRAKGDPGDPIFSNPWGMDIDERNWKRFWADVKAELAKRNENEWSPERRGAC